MKKIKTYSIFLIVLFVLGACKTADKDVEQIIYRKQSPATLINPYKNEFATKIQGTYKMKDKTILTINASGNFILNKVTFTLHDAISDTQGIYSAASPDPDKNNKNIYTYHGVTIQDSTLLNVPFKSPDSSKQRLLTEKETKHAWAVNTFQIENIDWKSGFLTSFASKQDSKTN